MLVVMQHLSFTVIMIMVIFKLSKINAWSLEVFPSFRCIIIGSSASFNCLNYTDERNALYPHNVYWYKILADGRLNPISSSTEGRVRSDGHQLRFSNVIAEDEGIYCCKAISSSRCSQTAMTNLSLALPPVLSHLPDQNVLTGDTVLIECILNYTGKPAATMITWQKFGSDMLDSKKYRITQSENGSSLTIANVTEEDTGSYSCITYNAKYLQDNESMLLHVHELSTDSPDNINSSIIPCNMTEAHPITIGLHIAGDCSELQESNVHNVINRFLFSLCNCDDYCIKVNYITPCSYNNENPFVITTVAITGEQALSLQNQTYAKLQRVNTTVEFESNIYYIFCVIISLCGDPHDNNGTVSLSNDTKDEVSIQVIFILLVLILVVVITLLLSLVIIRIVMNKKNLGSQTAKGRSQPHTFTTEVVSELGRNEMMGNYQLTDSDLHVKPHEYEDPDIALKHTSPTCCIDTGTLVQVGEIENYENNSLKDDINASSDILQPSSDVCAFNGNSKSSCLQTPTNISINSDVKYKSEESQMVNDNSTTAYDDTVILQSNHTNTKYDRLQHGNLKTNELSTDNNGEIVWVTNPNYEDTGNVPIAHVDASKNSTAYFSQLPYEVIDGAYYETENSLNTNPESSTLSEGDKRFTSTTWDKDRSSYVIGYSYQFKTPHSRSFTSNTCRDIGNDEVPMSPIKLVFVSGT